MGNNPNIQDSDSVKFMPLKYRAKDWLNTDTMEAVYGVQAHFKGSWVHVARNGEPLFFDTEYERTDWLKKARKKLKLVGDCQ